MRYNDLVIAGWCGGCRRRGISYLIDDTGKKKVMIDLADWGKLWEDFQDVMVSEARKDEPTVPWEELNAGLEK